MDCCIYPRSLWWIKPRSLWWSKNTITLVEYPIVKPIFLSGSAHPEAVENSETVPLLCCATQKKERLYEAVSELRSHSAGGR